MTKEEVRLKLFCSDEEYKKFSIKLLPGVEKIIGVRVPEIKELAKEISKTNYVEYLKNPLIEYYEERLLYGLIIGYIKDDIEKVLEYFDKWINCVDNWAVCDSAVMNLKTFSKEKNRLKVWEYLNLKYKNTNESFALRVIIVTLFCYFNDSEHINEVVKIYEGIKDENYYVKMALAWGIAEIAIKHYDIAIKMLKNGKLDSWVHNKAIQKCCESFRITPNQKLELKKLKR